MPASRVVGAGTRCRASRTTRTCCSLTGLRLGGSSGSPPAGAAWPIPRSCMRYRARRAESQAVPRQSLIAAPPKTSDGTMATPIHHAMLAGRRQFPLEHKKPNQQRDGRDGEGFKVRASPPRNPARPPMRARRAAPLARAVASIDLSPRVAPQLPPHHDSSPTLLVAAAANARHAAAIETASIRGRERTSERPGQCSTVSGATQDLQARL
jgi:hypothetical protein